MTKLKLLLVVAVVMMVLVASSYSFFMKKKETQRLFSFYLPWSDSEETVVSVSSWLDKPAGSLGHVYVGDEGHLFVGSKRIRFLGVNICGGAAFPKKEDAEKIAARLAKFGVNIVRFHHMDASWEAFIIFDKSFGNTRHLNQEALDRLDYFISKLKENGIYVDLNLLVSRGFTSTDGLPNEINMVDWKDQQVIGFYSQVMMDLQKEYAQNLLSHHNPYTGLTYAEDPAIAFVEIVNEQGLLQGWLGGVIDRFPEVFKAKLSESWNSYLKAKYGETQNLIRTWGGESQLPQNELLQNGNFEAGLQGWTVENHDGAQSSNKIIVTPDGNKALEIAVTKAGSAGWHAQFNYPGLEVEAEQTYLIKFWARAERSVELSVSLVQAHEPWMGLSSSVTVDVTTEWKEYEMALISSEYENNTRLDISNLGTIVTTYQFSNFSMTPFGGYALREGESLENSSVRLFTIGNFGSRNINARIDWANFLWSLEDNYFSGMRSYLKDELKVKALIIGTIVGCSTPNIMANLDVIDSHAYWQHPDFPGIPWDSSNWYVVNEPMVNHLNDSTISGLALKRVYGKPHLVTEYNHPAPNMYDAEAAITLATYGALQDWDGIFLFDYGSLDNWDTKQIRGYFDIDQDPVKMATLIPAYMIFAREDVKPAEKLVVARLNKQAEIKLLAAGKARSWNLPDGGYVGIQSATAIIHRTALLAENRPTPTQSLNPEDVVVSGPLYRSDTGEVIWDVTKQDKDVLLINSSKSIGILGFSGDKNFDFDKVKIQPENTLLDGWSVVTLTVMSGEDFNDWSTLLLFAGGYATNTNIKLTDYSSETTIAVVSTALTEIKKFKGQLTCSNNWGQSPTLVEGVPLTIRIKTSKDIGVWALDNTGKRLQQVPVSTEGNYKVFRVGPEYKTIWYEVTVKSG